MSSGGSHSASDCHSTSGNGNASGEGNQPAAWRRAFNEAIEADQSFAMPREKNQSPPGSQPPASTSSLSVTDDENIWRCRFSNFCISMRPVNEATPSFPSSNGPLPPCDSNEGNPEPSTR
ncbi:hypothetical protein MA16_Dca024545 [Dendrobium catenatum]|uniref:Uncharacterized protein n=1 Tax=Dendrobium catenatum TaxID=906689 RepID=A0A2I0WE23_9ASPA|nr:hypothetical protein MA16_Dca024545 [Dendrobium catenatum]